MSKSENINELAGALAKAQGSIKDALKDSKNPFFKSSYADLSSVWAACRTPLSSNGLSVTQMLDDTERGLVMTTMLMHASGQWVASTLQVIPVKNDPQGIGSAITYMRRYSLAALVGVAPAEDDDGNAASEKQTTKSEQPRQPNPAPVVPPADAIDAPPSNKMDQAKERVVKHARSLDALSKQARAAGDIETAERFDTLLREVKRVPKDASIAAIHELADKLKAAETEHTTQMQGETETTPF